MMVQRTGLQRPAFSLTELVVAVGLLVLMLSLAGTVMSITVQSTGQAKSLSEVNQALRVLEQTLRDDLRNVTRGQSLILIQGNPINAYWTALGRDADDDRKPETGYPHQPSADLVDQYQPGQLTPPRADILMFFTARRATSISSAPLAAGTVPVPTSGNLQLVVYGHAHLGEWVYGGTPPTYSFRPNPEQFPIDPEEFFPIPAESWHLARRNVLLMPGASPISSVTNDPIWANSPPADASELNLGMPSILEGQFDVVANFDYAAEVLIPLTTSPAGKQALSLPRIFDPAFNASAKNIKEWPRPWPFERSGLDLTTPMRMANRMGHYFLPNCASFKVEWALDPDSEFVGGRLDYERDIYWFDPGAIGDPTDSSSKPEPLGALKEAAKQAKEIVESSNSFVDIARAQGLKELLEARLGGQDVYSLEERFSTDPNWRLQEFGQYKRTNTVVFTANRVLEPGADPVVPDEVFPGALRITVDMYDSARRLSRPIRHVMVIPVGG